MGPKLASIQGSADWLIKQNDDTIEGHDIISDVIRSKVKETFEPVNDLTKKVADKQEELAITYSRTLDFDELCKEFSKQLSEVEARTVALKALSVKPDVLHEQSDQVSSIEKELSRLGPLCKRIINEGKKRAATTHGKEKDGIEDRVKELTGRKEKVDEILKVRRSEMEALQPVVKEFDETAKSIEPLLRESEDTLLLLRDVPTNDTSCEQQKIQLKVRTKLTYLSY